MEQWAIFLATLLGPVLAVLVTRWKDQRDRDRERKMFLFRTLMGTRRTPLNPDHVRALNFVEVEFHHSPKVIDEWKKYIAHLSGKPVEGAALDRWSEEGDKQVAKLLYEMGRSLGFDIGELQIFRGGYAPIGWQREDERRIAVADFMIDLSQGRKVVPVVVLHPPQPAADQPAAPPAAIPGR